MQEMTLIILKPDTISRGHCGEIISRFEKKGLKIIAMKMGILTDELCNLHYSHLIDKPFFKNLKNFMSVTPVIFAVLMGPDAVDVVRKMMGPTNSIEALPGTIRGDFGLSVQSNLIHGSDSIESAQKEIQRFFKDEEIFNYKKVTDDLIF